MRLSVVGHDGRTDPLTGVASRATVLDVLDGAGTEDRFTLLIADLDGFTDVNDRLGYRTGDGVLREFALRLCTDQTLDAVTVGRTGDDEFGVVVNCLAAHVGTRAKRVIALAEQPFEVVDATVELSASVGVTASPAPEGAPANDVVHWAVRACHVARRRGGGRYVVYSLAMSPSHRARLLAEHLTTTTSTMSWPESE